MSGQKTNYFSEPCSCIAVKVFDTFDKTSKVSDLSLYRVVGERERLLANEKTLNAKWLHFLKQKRLCDRTEIPGKSIRKRRKRGKQK